VGCRDAAPHDIIGQPLAAGHEEQLLSQVAAARGVDMAALLNQIVADAIPELQAWLSYRDVIREALWVEGDFVYTTVPQEHFDDVVDILDKAWALPSDEQKDVIRREVRLAVEAKKGGSDLTKLFLEWIDAVLALRKALGVDGKVRQEDEEEKWFL
jgi:hypothetical protein